MLSKMFRYEPDTGKLYNKYNRNPRALKDAEVGSKHHSGYYQVQIDGKLIMVHRIIWEMHYGKIPKGMEIDHINHVRDDNRLENLRLVTRQGNRRNQRITSRNKTSGVMGVYWNKQREKWHAQIKVDGKAIYLGQSDNFDEAVRLRKDAELKYNFHKNHGGK